MKTLILLVSIMLAMIVLKAQNYQISFTGSGQSSTVDSIQIENLTQGTSLTLDGNDVLHLVVIVGIHNLPQNKNTIKVYPNPMIESTIVEFTNSNEELACIKVYNEIGILIAEHEAQIHQGKHRFEIMNLESGVYTVNVSTANWKYATKIISLGNNSGKSTIKHLNLGHGSTVKNALKGTKDLIQMQYNDGEIILFKGYTGDYTRVFTLVPTQSQTVNFEFIPCSDEDGNNYAVVTIGTQTWFAENLNYETPNSWWCNNNSANGDVYGRLYTWYDALTACPTGWHLPSDNEWTILADYLDGTSVAGGKMREVGTEHWDPPNTDATNSSGFTGLPGAWRHTNGAFGDLGGLGYWWSATEYSYTNAWHRSLLYLHGGLNHFHDGKGFGFSIRCIKD